MRNHALIRFLTIGCLLVGTLVFRVHESYCQDGKNSLKDRAEESYKEALLLYNNGDIGIDSVTIFKFETAKALHEAANISNLRFADILLKLGSCYQDVGAYHPASKQYQYALKVREELKVLPDLDQFDLYASLGDIHYKQDQYDSSLYYYNIAHRTLSLIDGPKEEELYRLSNAWGAIFYSAGNYKQSINYFEKALEVSNAIPDIYPEDLIYINSNLAAALSKLDRNEEAVEKFQKVLKLGQNANILDVISPFLYHNLGRAYLESGSYDSALIYLKKVKVESVDIKLQIKLSNSIGDAHTALKNYDKAIKHYNTAIEIHGKNYSFSTLSLVNSYIKRGKAFEKMNKIPEALNDYQRAIIEVHYSFSEESPIKNPEDIGDVISPMFLFKTLAAKAGGLSKLYVENNNINNLKSSLNTYRIALKVCDNIRKSYDSDEAKIFFSTVIHPVFEEAMEVTYLLFEQTGEIKYLEEAFSISERSKAAVLSETVKDIEFKKIPGIEEKLILKEKELKKKVAVLTIALAESTKDEDAIKKDLRETEIELAKVYKDFEKNPAYYQLKYDNKILNVDSVRNAVVNSRSALLEYFIGERNLYAFMITREDFKSFSIPITKSLLADLSNFREELSSLIKGKKYKGDSLSFKLYQKLLVPFADYLTNKDHLLIIPDGILTLIPFEVMIKEFEDKRYLINEFTFSYAYSANIKYNTQRKETLKDVNAILAFAPFSGPNEERNYLKASRNEIEAIGGKMILDSEATKARFISTANQYDVIHLATHARENSTEPLNSYINFYANEGDSASAYQLYTHEIYNLTLDKVKMVVLNGCETGSGKIEQGEGAISLARAFSYAGCPNVIMSLWEADDNATALIASDMFRYLKEGFSKDEALQKAKIDYLNNDTVDKRFKTPQYWAHLVFWGNNDPIYTKSARVKIFLLFSTLISCIFLLFYIKRKRNREKH